MLRLAEVLEQYRISRRSLAKAARWSETALGRLIHQGEYPARELPKNIQARIRQALRDLGCSDEAALTYAFDVQEVATTRSNEPSPDAVPGQQAGQHKEVAMLIRKQSVSLAARDFFGLRPDALITPWRRDQVFMGGEMRVIYEHMLAKARFGGMLAITGESGAGKTTMKDLLIGDLCEEGKVTVIEPHTQAMEADDKAGKTLKSAHLCEAIIREVAPGQPLKRTMEGRLNQIAGALAKSLDSDKDRRHVMLIDEAHALPKPTLRQFKRFMEMKHPERRGIQQPLLSIILVGQPELSKRLSPFDQDVREVWQRCELVTLPPLNRELEDYIKFRLGAAAAAFTPDAVAMLRSKLLATSGESFLYPLAVDNWLAAVLNQAAGLSKTITGELVAEVHRNITKALMGGK